MALWTDEYLLQLREDGEVELSCDVPLLLYRYPLQIVSGQSEYTLPSGIVNILRISYKGYKVYPYSSRLGRDEVVEIRPDSTVLGRPSYYITRDNNWDTIKFFPTPNENLSTDSSTKDTGTGILAQCIITCYMQADVTGDTLRIPEYIRRQFTKYYVMYRAYAKEGKSQNIVASNYFKQKYFFAREEFRKIIHKMPRAISSRMEPGSQRNVRPARPSLPSNFGRIVE